MTTSDNFLIFVVQGRPKKTVLFYNLKKNNCFQAFWCTELDVVCAFYPVRFTHKHHRSLGMAPSSKRRPQWIHQGNAHEPDAALLRTPNGMRLLLVPMEDAQVCHIRVAMNTGQDHEADPHMREVSHFTEHLQAQWTSDEHPEAQKLTMQTSKVGFDSNASVEADTSTFWMTCRPEDLAYFVRIMMRSLTHFKVDSAILDQERSAVQEELRAILSDPWTEMHYRVLKEEFGDHPRATHVRMQLENTARLTKEDVLAYRQRFYRARGTVMVLSGRLLEKPLTDALVTIKENALPSGAIPSFPSYVRPPPNEPRTLRVITEGTGSSCRVQVFFRTGLRLNDPDSIALRVACMILTGGFHSRLYRTLRTDMGLVYYVSASVASEATMTSMSRAAIVTECAAPNVTFVVRHILKEIDALASEAPTSDEIARARNSLRIDQLRMRQGRCPEHIAATYGHSLLKYGHVQGEERVVQMMNAVDADAISSAVGSRMRVPFVVCGGEDPPDLEGVFQ